MNYFELLQIPVQLKPDKELVRRKYFEQIQKLNKDPSATEEKVQNLNKAYQTFNNSDETILYVLKWKGLLSEKENYKLPPSFLLQTAEIIEPIRNPNLLANPNKRMLARAQLVEPEKKIYEPVKSVIESYKESITTSQELLQVKDYYFKKKYLHQVTQQLEGKL